MTGEVETELVEKAQIYYASGSDYDGGQYVESSLTDGMSQFDFDSDKIYKKLRFDLTSKQGEIVTVEQVEIIYTNYNKVLFAIFCPILIIMYSLFVIIYINRRDIYQRLSESLRWKKRIELIFQIFSLAISDFQARFSGSYLGIFWGIMQPLSTILLFWFVFQVGFRSSPIDDVPFILWLAAGMIPWNYFYDAWFSGTSSFTSYSYIVKKVVFKVEMLPIVRALSSAILNLIFNLILIAIYVLYGRFPGVHIVDMIYFSFSMAALALGLTYFTATFNVFMKDVGQFLGIILQVLMWITPMMWPHISIPEKYSFFYKLNPLHYVINGYRESLINGHWFFYHYKLMIWFWLVTILLIVVGNRLMKKLKPHFADVL